MPTISNIAQRILDENGHQIDDFPGLTLTIIEYKIDDIIDYINAETGLSISHLDGSEGSKSWTYTAPQNIAVKTFANLLLKAFSLKGQQMSIESMNITYVESDPEFRLSMDLIKETINRLKQPPIYLSEDPVETE